MNDLTGPIELTEAELDAVAAAGPRQALAQLGLVNVGSQITIVDFIDTDDITIELLSRNRVEITNVANNNTIQVGVGAAVAVLSGAALGLVRQLA